MFDLLVSPFFDSQGGQIKVRFGGTLRVRPTFNEQAHQFNNRIDKVEKDAQAGIAMAIATAGLPQAYLPGKSMFAVGAGTYRGEQGYAMGVSHITDDGHWVLKATGSGNSQGHFGGSVGVGYQW